jgi:hypothetical protein
MHVTHSPPRTSLAQPRRLVIAQSAEHVTPWPPHLSTAMRVTIAFIPLSVLFYTQISLSLFFVFLLFALPYFVQFAFKAASCSTSPSQREST